MKISGPIQALKYAVNLNFDTKLLIQNEQSVNLKSLISAVKRGFYNTQGELQQRSLQKMVKSYNQGKFNIKILQSDSFRLVEFLSFVYNIPRLNKNTLNGYDPTYYKSNELKQSDQVLQRNNRIIDNSIIRQPTVTEQYSIQDRSHQFIQGAPLTFNTQKSSKDEQVAPQITLATGEQSSYNTQWQQFNDNCLDSEFSVGDEDNSDCLINQPLPNNVLIDINRAETPTIMPISHQKRKLTQRAIRQSKKKQYNKQMKNEDNSDCLFKQSHLGDRAESLTQSVIVPRNNKSRSRKSKRNSSNNTHPCSQQHIIGNMRRINKKLEYTNKQLRNIYSQTERHFVIQRQTLNDQIDKLQLRLTYNRELAESNVNMPSQWVNDQFYSNLYFLLLPLGLLFDLLIIILLFIQ